MIGARLTEHQLGSRSPGLFTAEGCQYYVLVRPTNGSGQWIHNEHGPVELCNIHPTGEIRWSVRSYGDPQFLQAHEREAVEHFGIHPADKTEEQWKSELEATTIKWEDLSEFEQKLLHRLSGGRYVSIVQEMYFRNDEGERITIIGHSEESSALYELYQKGLAVVGGSSSGNGFYEMSHVYSKKIQGKITRLGSRLYDANSGT